MKKLLHLASLAVILLCLMISPGFSQDDANAQDGVDPNILIYSTTHPPIRYTTEKTGLIKVEIVSFNPLRNVELNGEPVTITDTRQVRIDIPYQLSGTPEEAVQYVITANTNDGAALKKFKIHYGDKPRKSSLQLIGILGLTSNDNINSETEDQDKDSDIKAVLTIVPKYGIPIGKKSTLQIKGIILREKYSNSDYKGKEVSYTQLAVGWIEKKTPFGELSADLGMSDIRMENANILVGENETSTEGFIKGQVEQQISGKSKWFAGLEAKVKDSETTQFNINYETDANEYTLSGGLKEPLLLMNSEAKNLKTAVGVDLSLNDAKGKYQDSRTYAIDGKLAYKIDDWTPQIKLKLQQKTMAIKDPLKDDKQPEYTTGTFSAGVKYKVLKKTVVSLEYKMKYVASNISSSNFRQNNATLSVIQIF